MFAIGQDDIVTHEHGGECGCGLGVAQSVHQFPFDGAHLVEFLRQPAGNPFAGQGYDDHHACHLQGIAVAEYHVYVDQHAHTDEEVGDEERVAHELQVVHQRGDVRDELVQHQSGEEGAEDALHAHELHQPAPRKTMARTKMNCITLSS